jgi:large subunit ribosomal protein L1
MGRVSFSETQLVENGLAVIDAVNRAKPAVAKGVYLRAISLQATMSPGIKLDASLYAKT